MQGLFERRYLVHHLLVNGQTTSGIDDDHVVTFRLRLFQSILCDGHHVLVTRLGIDGHFNGLADDDKLLDSSGTVDVAGYEQRVLMLLAFEHVGQFATEGGLTRTLQTRHEDDGWFALQVQAHGLATHQFSQLVVYELHHQLSGFHGGKHVHTQSFLLHLVGEGLGHFIVDVGINKCATYIFHRLGDVDFGYLAFALEYLKRAL